MDTKDRYETLGVARDASDEAKKRAFRKLARKYHPDVASDPKSEAKFKDVKEACGILKDPEKRAECDNPQPQQQFAGSPNWDGGFGFAHPGRSSAGGFENIFGSFYRSDPRTAGFGGRMSMADQHARIEVPLSDAFSGATRTLTLQVPQMNANGDVSIFERNIAVNISKGVTEGQNIRLRGQGTQMPEGGGTGDLYFEIVFAPHPVFRPEGRDLYLELPVTPWEAALGQKVVLPRPDGKVDLHIPKNARNGQKFRPKGKGRPTSPPGDIYATLQIVNPKVSTEQEQGLFKKKWRRRCRSIHAPAWEHRPMKKTEMTGEALESLTSLELCRFCDADETWVTELVEYSVLEPEGHSFHGSHFRGVNIARAKKARRLRRDFGINMAGVTMVLDLLHEREQLMRSLQRLQGNC